MGSQSSQSPQSPKPQSPKPKPSHSNHEISEKLKLDLLLHCGEDATSALLTFLFTHPSMVRHKKKIVVRYDKVTGFYTIHAHCDFIYLKVQKSGHVFPRGFFVAIIDGKVEKVSAFYPKFENIKDEDFVKFIDETGKKVRVAFKVSGSLITVTVRVGANGELEIVATTKKSSSDNDFNTSAKKILLESLGDRAPKFIKWLHDNKLSLSFEFASPDPLHGEHGSKIKKAHLVLIGIFDKNADRHMAYAEIEGMLKEFPEINMVEYIEVDATKENIEKIKDYFNATKSAPSMRYIHIKEGLYKLFQGQEVFYGGNHDYPRYYGEMLEGLIISTEDFSLLAKLKYLAYVGNTMLLRYFFGLVLNRGRRYKPGVRLDADADADAEIEADADAAEIVPEVEAEIVPEVVTIEDKDIAAKVKHLFKNFGYEGEEDYIEYVKGWVRYLQNKREQLGPNSSYLDELELYKATTSSV